MTPTQRQIIRVHGVLPLAMDNCLLGTYFAKKKKRAIKIKTEIGKRKLVRSYQDIFSTNSFR